MGLASTWGGDADSIKELGLDLRLGVKDNCVGAVGKCVGPLEGDISSKLMSIPERSWATVLVSDEMTTPVLGVLKGMGFSASVYRLLSSDFSLFRVASLIVALVRSGTDGLGP